MTVQTWMDHGDSFADQPFAGLVTRDGRQLVELAVESVFSAEPRDISMLHALFYTHAAGSFGSLINTDDGAQMYRLHGGSQLIAIRAANTARATGCGCPRRCSASSRPPRRRR